MEANAFEDDMGVVLMQEGHPIAYINKPLGPKQQTLSIYERKMMTILLAITKCRHYFWGRHFKICIDHSSLN